MGRHGFCCLDFEKKKKKKKEDDTGAWQQIEVRVTYKMNHFGIRADSAECEEDTSTGYAFFQITDMFLTI